MMEPSSKRVKRVVFVNFAGSMGTFGPGPNVVVGRPMARIRLLALMERCWRFVPLSMARRPKGWVRAEVAVAIRAMRVLEKRIFGLW